MNRSRLTIWAGGLAGVALLAGCTTTVPLNDPVYTRIDSLQQQVNKLQKLVKGQGLMNVASGQQQLTQQIADLQGQIQALQHQLAQQQQHERAVDQNFDQRLTVLEGGTPAGFAGGGASGTAGATGSGNAANPSGSPTTPPKSGAAGSGQSTDYAAYQAAFGKLRAGDNAGAITAFQKFIQQYPNSRFVPNAWYWMAETHYVNGQYKTAIDDFQRVLTKYPSSPKAPDSQLKIGYAQYALKDYKGARATFQTVIRKYPGTTSADLARQRLQKMGSQGG